MKKDRDPRGFAKWTSLFSLKLGLLFRQTGCFIFQPSQCLAVLAPGIGNNDPVVLPWGAIKTLSGYCGRWLLGIPGSLSKGLGLAANGPFPWLFYLTESGLGWLVWTRMLFALVQGADWGRQTPNTRKSGVSLWTDFQIKIFSTITPLPFFQIEYGSQCITIGSCCLFILYTVVYICRLIDILKFIFIIYYHFIIF